MRYCKPLPDAEYLRKHFEYNSDTGELVRVSTGNVITTKNSKGYIVVDIKGETFQATRLIWKIVHGVEPNGLLDHINHCVNDNRLSNLRETNNSRNIANTIKKLGYSVVKTSGPKNRLRVNVMKDGKRVYDRHHTCPLIARIDYCDKVKEIHNVELNLVPLVEIRGCF